MADSNTKLLLHFDGDFLDYSDNNHHPSTNGHFEFPTGKFNTGFATTAGKLEVTAHSDFDYNSDFTIDAWCYVSSTGSNQYLFNMGSSRDLTIYFRTGSYRRIYLYINNSSAYSGNGVIPLDEWFHFALVKSGSNYTCYVNGINVYTRSSAENIANGNLEVGSYNSSNYIESVDEFRYSDTARWSENFTPPASSYTSGAVTPHVIDDTPDFLLHFNDSFNATTGQRPILNGCFGFENGVFDKAIGFKYGNLIFDNLDAIKLGSADFTIDFWAKFESTSSYFIFDNGASSGYLRLSMYNTDELRLYCGSSSYTTSSANIVQNAWTHIAIVRTGDVFILYVNGQKQLNFTSSVSLDNTGQLYIGSRKDSESSYFRGLVDEFCITKGCAKWITNFTPPSAPYAGTTPAEPSEPTSDFLLHFDDSFMDCFGSQPKLNGHYSFELGRFDQALRCNYGNLIFENLDAIKLGSDDFTIDFWAKFESTSGCYIFDNGANNSSNRIRLYLYNTDELRIYYGGSYYTTSSANIPQNTWIHIALVRTNNILLIFINGQLKLANKINVTLDDAGDLYIGSMKDSESNYFRGLIDEFSIIKGKAKWVTEFDLPTSAYDFTTPPTPPTNTDCDLLLHFDGGVYDSSGKDHTVAESDWFEFENNGKFGKQAIFDGEKYLTVFQAADWELPDNFTIDFWLKLPTDFQTGRYIFSLGQRQLSLMTYSGNRLRLYLFGSYYYLPTDCITAEQWQHIAITRVGRILIVYIDGSVVYTSTISAAITPTTGLFVGSDNNSSNFIGQIDEFRVVKNRCEWCMDFIPPALPYDDPELSVPETAPVLKSPSGYTFKNKILLQWRATFQANTYDLEITRLSDGHIDTFTDLIGLSYEYDLLTDTYSWRVRSKNHLGTGPWSAPMQIEKRDVVLDNPIAEVSTGFPETLYATIDMQLYQLHYHDTETENSKGWKDDTNHVRLYYNTSYSRWQLQVGNSTYASDTSSWKLNSTDGSAGLRYDYLYDYNRTFYYLSPSLQLAANPPIEKDGTCQMLAFDWDFDQHLDGTQITADNSTSITRSHFWKVRLFAGTEYTFENMPIAGGRTSSYLNLYDKDGRTLLKSNNGFYYGNYASITFKPTVTAIYYIEQEGNYGSYTDYTSLYLLQSTPAPTPGIFAMNLSTSSARFQYTNYHHFKYEIERYLNFATHNVRFTVNVYQDQKNISRYDLRSRQVVPNIDNLSARAKTESEHLSLKDARQKDLANNMPVINSSFVNPGWSIHAKNIDTGQLQDLGFIPIDTPPAQRKLQDIPLANGIWEIEVRLHQFYWADCRWRKITTLVVTGEIIDQESLSVIHNLRHSVEHFRAVLRWEVVDERNPKYHHFAIWFSDNPNIDTANLPADKLLHVPATGSYKYDFAQELPMYAAVATIRPDGSEIGPVAEIYCPWSLIMPDSPSNQQAIHEIG